MNPNSDQDVKKTLTPSITIPSSSCNPYAGNPSQDLTKSFISYINGFESDDKQIFPFINPSYYQDLSPSDSNNNTSGTSGFLLNHNMCDHYNNHTSFSSDVNGKRSEIMTQEEIMMMMMIDHHIDQRTKGHNGDFTHGCFNYYNGHGDLKQMISGTCTNSNINTGGSGSSSSTISNLAENKSSSSLLQHKCLPYFYS